MATIPNARAGQRPTPQPARGIANTEVAARGLREAATIQSQAANVPSQTLKVVSDVAEIFLVEQQRNQYAEARSAWASGVIALDEKYREDQEYDTLHARYTADINTLHGTVAQNLPGNLRQSFGQVTEPDRARASANIQGLARDRAHDATRAGLVESLGATRRAYLTAGSPVGRDNALEAANAAISLAVVRGAIDEETAMVQRRKFAADSATDRISMMPAHEQIQTLLGDNPLSLAMDPSDREKYLRLAVNSLDEGPSEAFKESSGRLANEMLIGISQGRLTSNDVVAARQDLTRQDERVLINALGDLATPDTDPFTFVDLHTRAIAGEDIMDAARMEYENRNLSQSDYTSLTGMVLDRPGPDPIYDRAHDDLVSRLGPSQFESRFDREGAATRTSRAVREFDDWIRVNPKAAETEIWDKVDQIGQRWSAIGSAAVRRNTLPKPMFYQNVQTEDDLNLIQRRITDHFLSLHGGEMDFAVFDPEFIAQMEYVQQWRDFLADQE